jgi:hypothetical protein
LAHYNVARWCLPVYVSRLLLVCMARDKGQKLGKKGARSMFAGKQNEVMTKKNERNIRRCQKDLTRVCRCRGGETRAMQRRRDRENRKGLKERGTDPRVWEWRRYIKRAGREGGEGAQASRYKKWERGKETNREEKGKHRVEKRGREEPDHLGPCRPLSQEIGNRKGLTAGQASSTAY